MHMGPGYAPRTAGVKTNDTCSGAAEFQRKKRWKTNKTYVEITDKLIKSNDLDSESNATLAHLVSHVPRSSEELAQSQPKHL